MARQRSRASKRLEDSDEVAKELHGKTRDGGIPKQ